MNHKLIFYYAFLIVSSLLVAFLPFPAAGDLGKDQIIDIQASQFQFEPGTIKVKPGDQVTINLTALDVAHGIYLDGYGLDLKVDPGQTKSFTFTADRQGSFRFRCSVSCGAFHPFMIGKFQVGPNSTLLRGVGLSAIALIAIMTRSKF
jgi:heme/copper-type cytochrome/quinol oxidase subunit 2